MCGVLEALVVEVLHDELKNLALVQEHVLAHDHRPFRLRPLLACPYQTFNNKLIIIKLLIK